MKHFNKIVIGLFILELIFGFNGTLLIIADFGIRKLLFATTNLIFTIMILILIRKVGLNYILKHYITNFDCIFLAFLLVNTIWIFIVPYYTHSSVSFALKETACTTVLFLYFPIIILTRSQQVNWNKSMNFILYSILGLGLLYVILFIGELYTDGELFVINYLELFSKVPFTTSIRPLVMYPFDYVRLIFPNSVLFFLLFYAVVKLDFNKRSLPFYLIGIVALLTTITKALIYSTTIAFCIFILFFLVSKNNFSFKEKSKRTISFLLIGAVLVILLNFTLFDNYIFTRFEHTFNIQKEEESYSKSTAFSMDSTESIITARTKESNSIRLEQTTYLINKWSERPLMGFGYGSYVESYVRGGTTPYSYE